MKTGAAAYLRKVFQDDLLTQSAAVAYYASLSIPPLVLLALSAMSMLGLDLSEEFMAQVEGLLGERPAAAIIGVIRAARTYSFESQVGRVIGTILLLFSASAVMAQLHAALNQIYGPTHGRTVFKHIFIQRVVSVFVVLIFIVLALVSIFASVLLGASAIHTLVSIGLFFSMFTLLFRFVPDCPPSWRACAAGGFATMALFMIGKAPITMVIEKYVAMSLYGTAGTLMLLLVWVYYSCLIICLGAELSYFIDRRV